MSAYQRKPFQCLYISSKAECFSHTGEIVGVHTIRAKTNILNETIFNEQIFENSVDNFN